MAEISVIQGDITARKADAIVNAANTALAPGGGVCGVIHRAAGPALEAACRKLGGVETGGAVITPGYDLPARYVIHAAGPVWHGGTRNEPALLAGCYTESLTLADANGLASIAFPAISTGIFGYPVEGAARVAVAAIKEWLHAHPVSTITDIKLVCFSDADRAVYAAAAADNRH